MKPLIMLSTALFAAAAAFGIVYFVQHADNPVIQNLYSHTTPEVEFSTPEVTLNIPEHYVNSQNEIDTIVPQKTLKKSIGSTQKRKINPKVLPKQRVKHQEQLSLKSFSRAAIPENVAPIPTHETDKDETTENRK